MSEQDQLTLKWGTLKAWNLHSPEALEIMRQYMEIGISASAMLQNDTPRQKELLCQLIDACNSETIYLDWDDLDVSKDDAKKYVMEYPALKVKRGTTP